MELLSTRVITDNWDFLISDLQGDVVIYSKSILTNEEYLEINDYEDEREIIENFLNKVKNKSDEQLEVFVCSLQQYYPWLYDGLKGSISNLKETDTLHPVKALGGIPNLPLRMIQRNDLLEKVKNSLKTLKKGNYLILHGMLGCGKTTLASAALYDNELVKNSFESSVFWLTVGNLDEEDIITLFQELNERLPEPVEQLSALPHLAAIQLTKRFIDKELTHSLIVLDDVKSQFVLDSFAIGAKFLVITEDKGVIGNKLESVVHCIKVDEGFSTNETLELFSKSLNIKSHLLPEQATEIHRYTKGHPLTVSLIASQLENYKDSVSSDENRWDYYINMLSNKKFRRRSLNDFQTFYNAIQGSVDSLDSKAKTCFQQLAVFVEDVNIKPEVLGTLWDLDKYEAEEVMMDFVKKSLAVKKWSEVQNSYVYGVHDLVCDFLKKDLSKKDEELLHCNLIFKYETKCGGEWCHLPKDDNYIFYYIGYHLRKAGSSHHHLFQKLYFDLSFLETKIRLCGPADLIRDYKNYKELITQQDKELEQRVGEFSSFVEYHGVSIAKGIDIIQAALQEPTTSSVHVAAVQLAKSKNTQQLYLHSIPLQDDNVILPETMEIPGEVDIVAFGTSINEVIVASERDLKLYNIRAKGVLKDYKGHNGKITNVDVSECGKIFLSTSLDNTVRIWSLENGKSSLGDRTPSPVERQSGYMPLFSQSNEDNGFWTDKAIHVLQFNSPLIWGVFSKEDPSLIVTLGFDGSICLWKDYKKKWVVKHNFPIKCVDFFNCDNNKFVAAGGTDQIMIYFQETGNLYQQRYFQNFISFRSLPGSLGVKLVILTEDELIIDNQTKFYSDFFEAKFKQLHSVGSHIAVTSESGELYVFHFLNDSIVARFPIMSRQAKSICVNDRAILSGFSDGSIFLYPLEELPSPLNSVKWSSGHEPILVKMDHSQENIEVVIGSNKPIIVKRSTRIKIADVSSDGEAIAMAFEDGKIAYKLLKSDVPEQIIIEQYPVPAKLYLFVNGTEHLVVALYEQHKALLWKVNEKKLVELNDIRSIGCSSASLLQLKTCNCLITAFPMTVWTLDGHLFADCGIAGIHLPVDAYCVSPKSIELVYIVKETCYLNTFNGEIHWNMKDPKLMCFSPSGNILAIINKTGILTVFNLETMTQMAADTERKDTTCLSVSDSGCVCFGGNNNLSIVTKEGLSSKIVLNTRSIVSEPDGGDKFAVADYTGILYIVYQDIINGECTRRLTL